MSQKSEEADVRRMPKGRPGQPGIHSRSRRDETVAATVSLIPTPWTRLRAVAVALTVITGTGLPAALAAADAAMAQDLTLRRVILSTGGVAYLEHEAVVDGDADLSLPVPLDDVDDLLKSLVVYDAQGTIASASLPGREPLAEVFRNLSFPSHALSSMPALLQALIGAGIQVNGRTAAEGRLLSVEAFEEPTERGEGIVTRHRLSIMTALGLKQAVLEDIKELRFTDDKLQAEIDRALVATAGLREKDRRTLTLRLRGGERRTIAIGYVVAAPVWKSAYRLVLPPETGGTIARVQGWAILENLTGTDWDGVTLTLVSGNPVAYRQSLYEPYRLERSELPVAVMGQVLPRRDDGAMSATLGGAADGASLLPAPQTMARSATGGLSMMMDGPSQKAEMSPTMAAVLARPGQNGAAAQEAATQVMFGFPEPLRVPAGNSVMVPIIDRPVPAERVSVYQPDRHSRHPFAAVTLTNDSGTSLPPGIVTLYGDRTEGGVGGFIGDAEFAALPAGEKRFISFALDKKTQVDQEETDTTVIEKVGIERGVIHRSLTDRSATTYTLRAPALEDRTIVLEHPRRPGWSFSAPDGTRVEETERHYRVTQRIAAGETVEVTLRMERTRAERTILMGQGERLLDTRYLAQFFGDKIDRQTRTALERLAELQRATTDAERRIASVTANRDTIVSDQARIRENLGAVPEDSDLGRRYLAQLSAQEDTLAALARDLQAAESARDEARRALETYIAGLTL